jgi:hypothetical protein
MIMYWDEPTITLDYDEHDCHPTIHRNWSENIIPNVVLSSATLPSREELCETITDFHFRFPNSECHEITSYDSRRSIQLLNSEGYVSMPHLMCENHQDALAMAEFCNAQKTLYRYIDLHEAARFIIRAQGALTSPVYAIENLFESLEGVTLERIKSCYIQTLAHIRPECWGELYDEKKAARLPSNIHVATTDAHTLTNGPTIFLADDIQKVARFYLQEAKIPPSVARRLKQSIAHNVIVETRLTTLQKNFEDGTSKDAMKERKMADGRVDPEMVTLQKEIDRVQGTFKQVSLDAIFVPNTPSHLDRYAANRHISSDSVPFSCDIEESTIADIMQIENIDDTWKMLLLMGIGVFAEHQNPRYTEIMKSLANQQKLYLIIASTDYIYGTNYQFCHGYIGKDLGQLSREKCIQAIGRVGRNHTRQHYTVRFRDDALIYRLFTKADDTPEVVNMAKLFHGALA